jgi:hypothetical protein
MRRDDHLILDAPARYPPYTKSAMSIFKAAAKLPPIPPVGELVRKAVVVGVVAAGAFYAHKTGLFAQLVKIFRSGKV